VSVLSSVIGLGEASGLGQSGVAFEAVFDPEETGLEKFGVVQAAFDHVEAICSVQDAVVRASSFELERFAPEVVSGQEIALYQEAVDPKASVPEEEFVPTVAAPEDPTVQKGPC
jgi:hypothetical protein